MQIRANLGRIALFLSMLWIATGVIIPVWQGQSYSYRPGFQVNPVMGFALEGSMAGFAHAPLWNPPRHYNPEIPTYVRWPWQPVHDGSAVEIAVPFTLLQISMGLVLLGFIARLLAPLNAPPLEQRYVKTAWCWAWAALAAVVVYFVIWLASLRPNISISPTGTLICYFGLLAAIAVRCFRFPLGRATSLVTGHAAIDEFRRESLASFRHAVRLVVGLVAGGGLGFVVAKIHVWIYTSQPSPEHPGLAGPIGNFFALVIGTAIGSMLGVGLAVCWRRLSALWSKPSRLRTE